MGFGQSFPAAGRFTKPFFFRAWIPELPVGAGHAVSVSSFRRFGELISLSQLDSPEPDLGTFTLQKYAATGRR